jgi:OTU domain-containing protein 5
MRKDEVHFENFVSGMDFTRYLALMSKPGTFGDNLEIQSIAELYNRPVIVYSTDVESDEEEDEEEEVVFVEQQGMKRVKKLEIFHSTYDESQTVPIRLCYRGRNHYDAVVDPTTATIGVGLGFDPSFVAGKADLDLLQGVANKTDLQATQEEMEKAIMQASLSEFTSSSISAAAAAAPATTSSVGDDIKPVVRELVLNGFPLDRVVYANRVVGDSFDDMLNFLLSEL